MLHLLLVQINSSNESLFTEIVSKHGYRGSVHFATDCDWYIQEIDPECLGYFSEMIRDLVVHGFNFELATSEATIDAMVKRHNLIIG